MQFYYTVVYTSVTSLPLSIFRMISSVITLPYALQNVKFKIGHMRFS